MRELLALSRRESRLAVAAIGAGARDPDAKIRLGQVEIPGHAPNALAFVEHQPAGLGFELVIELPARTPVLVGRVGHWSGHRIRLSEDVHQTGSSPPRCPMPITG